MSEMNLKEKERKFALLSHLKKQVEEQLKQLKAEILESYEPQIKTLETSSFSVDIDSGSSINYTKKYMGYDETKVLEIIDELKLDKEVAFDKKVSYALSASKLKNMVDVGLMSQEVLDGLRSYSVSMTPKLSKEDKATIEEGL